MRRMVVTHAGEVRQQSLSGAPKRIMPMRQHGLADLRSSTKGGLTSMSAPLKTEMQHFDSKHGFPQGSFGETGLTGET